MMRNKSKLRRTPESKKRKLQNHKMRNEEEIEKNEEIFMVELQSEDNEKKAEVVLGKQTMRNKQLRNKQ